MFSCGTGLLKVLIRATNAFSSSDVEVDLEEVLQVCQNHSETFLSQNGEKVCISMDMNGCLMLSSL